MSGRLALVGVALFLAGGRAFAEEPAPPKDPPGEGPAPAPSDAPAPASAPSDAAAPAPAPSDAAPPASAFTDAGGEEPRSEAAEPAASTAPAATTAPPRTGGLIPNVLLGPKVTATLLFPPNVMVGGELKIAGWVGASYERAVFPTERTIGSGTSYGGTISAWSAGLRLFPFRGSFFVGAIGGEYDVTVTQGVQGAAPGGAASVDTLHVKGTYLGPQIGWKWVSDVGLFAGLNLGYGFSLSYASSFVPAIPGPPGGQTDLEQARKSADEILKSGVPILTLLELGWVF